MSGPFHTLSNYFAVLSYLCQLRSDTLWKVEEESRGKAVKAVNAESRGKRNTLN